MAASGSTLSLPQIIALWIKAGGPISTAPIAAARAMAESTGQTAVTSNNPGGGVNVGVWQLDTEGVGAGHSVSQLSDPLTNAKITVKATNGGRNWGEWSDNYQPFLAQAQADVANFRQKASGHSGGLSGLADDVLKGVEDIGSGAVGAVTGAVGQLLQLPSQVTGFLTSLEKPVQALLWIINPANVARVIAGVFGFLLLGAGLITLGLAA